MTHTFFGTNFEVGQNVLFLGAREISSADWLDPLLLHHYIN